MTPSLPVSLPMIAGFLIALGVLFVMMGSMRREKKERSTRLPPESIQILAILFFIAGFVTLAYAFYSGKLS